MKGYIGVLKIKIYYNLELKKCTSKF